MILHIIAKIDWAAAQKAGAVIAESLKTEGFIHCSTVDQVLIPANAFFAGRPDLLLLQIDEQNITAPVIFEDCYETGMKFPHIYGELNLDAVQQVFEFPPLSDGSFELPKELVKHRGQSVHF